jgi:hypothetical protein
VARAVKRRVSQIAVYAGAVFHDGKFVGGNRRADLVSAPDNFPNFEIISPTLALYAGSGFGAR